MLPDEQYLVNKMIDSANSVEVLMEILGKGEDLEMTANDAMGTYIKFLMVKNNGFVPYKHKIRDLDITDDEMTLL